MVEIEIPGSPTLRIENLLLDLNGTLAIDGVISARIRRKLNTLSQKLNLFILSAEIPKGTCTRLRKV